MKTIKLIFIAITMIASYSLTAQVSINTDGTDPNGSAMLDVKSTTKGFLLPRMTNNEIGAIVNPAEGLVVYCTETHKPVFYNGITWVYYDGTELLYIGKFYEGGVIFYLDGNGGGLVCDINNVSSGAQWGCKGTLISGADGTAIGTGSQNTVDIVTGCTTAGIAAYLCYYLFLNNYYDWFLPSTGELDLMYQNQATINATAIENGGSAFNEDYYWSSTESNNNNAWGLSFYTGTQCLADKSILDYVRAIRAF